MWYVIQTKSGEEGELKELINALMPRELYTDCFIPLFEDVRKRGGTGHISFRRLFPGYLFIDTESVEEVHDNLKGILRLSKLLAMPEKNDEQSFIGVTEEEKKFLETLLKNGVMHVSYIEMRGKTGKIEKIIGPLARYASRITRLDISHRMAIVETELFGKKRKIKFGLWTDRDPDLPGFTDNEEIDASGMDQKGIDIGIHPGDTIIDETGIYMDKMKVVSVNAAGRVIRATVKMLGSDVPITLNADDVRVV